MRIIMAVLCVGMLALGAAPAAFALDVKIGVLRVDYPQLAPISRFDIIPEDMGFAGAALGLEDNQTTGSFMGHKYEVTTIAVPPEEADAAFDKMLADGIEVVVTMARGDDLLRLADSAGDGVLLINAFARETSLRSAECRANMLHVVPSDAMMTDAVAQFAIWKQWPDWYLIEGSNPTDQLLGDEYRRAATKFGAKIVEERVFDDTGGSRRSDSGHVQVQKQLPVFTDNAAEHDIVIAADASDVFAPYLPFHQRAPRPVMGSAGLRPVTFNATLEAWGATQFQTRFQELTGRYVREEDYQVWLALRVIGEAVTRTSTAEIPAIRDYMLSPAFELAAFKGQKVTFRAWNGQMRQPVLLFDGTITVSVSPQEGFLHQRSPLDSLGLDAPESACTAFE